MDYREKVIAYANVIQIYSSEEYELTQLLDGKVLQASDDMESREFWTEVRGRIYRNSWYNEILEMIQLEKKHLGHVDSYPDVGTVANSPNLLKWLSYLPKFQDEVDFLLDYQKDNHITERPNDQQSFQACLNSLQFFNDAITADKTLEELFRYIPLMTWSIESLLVTKQMHPDFQSFLLDSFVPVLRAHKAALMVFVDLVNNEEAHMANADKNKETVTQSDIFTRVYEPRKINLSIPVDPRDSGSDADDIYLDALGYSLRSMFERNSLTGPRVEEATRDWYFAPLSHLYRLRIHSDMLGVTDSYTPVMSPKLLSNTSNKLYTHLKVYGERNLLESSILGIENLIMESQGSSYKELYKPRFKNALAVLQERLEDLLRVGLVTGKGISETLERVKLRGEAYDIYSADD